MLRYFDVFSVVVIVGLKSDSVSKDPRWEEVTDSVHPSRLNESIVDERDTHRGTQ